MLQSVGLQGVKHELAVEQQQLTLRASEEYKYSASIILCVAPFPRL